jgi:hypothetical protein
MKVARLLSVFALAILGFGLGAQAETSTIYSTVQIANIPFCKGEAPVRTIPPLLVGEFIGAGEDRLFIAPEGIKEMGGYERMTTEEFLLKSPIPFCQKQRVGGPASSPYLTVKFVSLYTGGWGMNRDSLTYKLGYNEETKKYDYKVSGSGVTFLFWIIPSGNPGSSLPVVELQKMK